MDIKVIKSAEDYEAVLGRIDDLMEVQRTPAQDDEFEVLVLLIEKYEEKNFPVGLPDPIEAIRFRMEQAGLKQKDLVPYLGSASKVSEVLRRKRPLSLSMMRALHRGLGIPAEVLLQDPGAAIPEAVPGLEWTQFPLREMLERGWLPSFRGSLADVKRQAEELVRSFLAPLGNTVFQQAFLRQHVRSSSTMDKFALLAWRARVLILAQQQSVPEYEPITMDTTFMQRLVHLSYLDEGPALAQEFLAKSGIRLVVERHLRGTHLDGAAMMLPQGGPVVALTLRYDRLDSFWFTLCHELAHLALHFKDRPTDCFVDDLKSPGDDLETEADEFASQSLIPTAIWEGSDAQRTGRPKEVRELAGRLRIHPAIVAGRVRRERGNYRLLSKLVGNREVRKCFGMACGIAASQ